MKLYQDLSKEPRCWTPRQIAEEMGIPQLWVLFLDREPAVDLEDWANKRRAAKGLPPIRMV